jgi:antitoxin component of RelBE/YafQ-DinJ toxin-antitoxin module
MTTKGKEMNINIRVRKEVRENFKIAADLRGASMSSLIHQFMVKCIRDEKKIAPEAFGKAENPTGKYEQEAVIRNLTEK